MACSTAKAVEWDAAWSKNLDPSGRAALGVHEAAYEETVDTKAASQNNGSPQKPQGTLEKTATVAWLKTMQRFCLARICGGSCWWPWEEGTWFLERDDIMPNKSFSFFIIFFPLVKPYTIKWCTNSCCIPPWYYMTCIFWFCHRFCIESSCGRSWNLHHQMLNS